MSDKKKMANEEKKVKASKLMDELRSLELSKEDMEEICGGVVGSCGAREKKNDDCKGRENVYVG
jgi:hypothetical protein